MLIFGHDREIAQWCGDQLGIKDFGPCSAIGVARDGKIVAGAVFHQFRFPNIEITFATTTPRWATRETIAAIMAYPFVQLKCRRLTAITEALNQPARAFLSRFGFTQEGYHPHTFAADDAVTYGLLREDAEKWLRKPDGQINTVRTANS